MNEKKQKQATKGNGKGGDSMIKGFVQGQTLKLAQTRVVADTIDYLIAKFHFQGEDWRGLEKWMHLQQGEQLYVIKLTDDRTQKRDHLNLSAGEWAVWLHGNENVDGVVTQRITTNICAFTVERSGALEGDAMPELPAGLGEQLQARIHALEEARSELPLIGEGDDGKVLTAEGGAWIVKEIEMPMIDTELSATSTNPVQSKVIAQVVQEANVAMTQLGGAVEAIGQRVTPEVGAADDGKVLTVVGGRWQAADAPSGGESITVDAELSATSENPVQNKVITEAFNEALEGVGGAIEVLAARVPDASASPNGSFLQVVDGAWAAVSLTDVSVEGA